MSKQSELTEDQLTVSSVPPQYGELIGIIWWIAYSKLTMCFFFFAEHIYNSFRGSQNIAFSEIIQMAPLLVCLWAFLTHSIQPCLCHSYDFKSLCGINLGYLSCHKLCFFHPKKLIWSLLIPLFSFLTNSCKCLLISCFVWKVDK